MMNNNFSFRSMIHLHGLSQDKSHLEAIFSLGGLDGISSRKIRGWRADTDSKSYIPMPDKALAAFFDGLFKLRNQRRDMGINVWALSSDTQREPARGNTLGNTLKSFQKLIKQI